MQSESEFPLVVTIFGTTAADAEFNHPFAT